MYVFVDTSPKHVWLLIPWTVRKSERTPSFSCITNKITIHISQKSNTQNKKKNKSSELDHVSRESTVEL